MTTADLHLDAEALYFLPLGGSGEIGMNLNLYACRGQWLMVDLGITFPGDTLPGIDIVMPDPAFIEAERASLLGIVLTHAHEDHLGAVAYLWPRLRCPIYATPFAAAVLRGKLEEANLLGSVPLTEVPLSGHLTLGPFAITFISLTHSIPEPNALLIETPFGTVMHTGDWKIDPEPLIGEPIDEAALQSIGDGGILALVGDSTNATVEGESGSEGMVRTMLTELVRRCERGVAVSFFASNVARLESIAVAAHENGREPVLVGRSLKRYVEAARACGYLDNEIRFLGEDEGAALHPENALYLCTGCQGEPRAAMARIAAGSHPRIGLGLGDTVIFSSKIIPGNERPIAAMHNRLVARGIEVITEKDHAVHVSGHPCRDELRRMYQWIRPSIAVPVHGETRHMIAHAELAQRMQVPEQAVITNGDVLRLAPGRAAVTDRVHTGRLALDGANLVPTDHISIRARRRLMYNGAVFVALVMKAKGGLAARPQISSQGVLDADEDEPSRVALGEAVEDAVAALRKTALKDDAAVREAARLAVRRALVASHGKRPVIEIQIVRLAP